MLSHSFKLMIASLLLVSSGAFAAVDVDATQEADKAKQTETSRPDDAAKKAAKGETENADTSKDKADTDKKVTDALRNRTKVGADQNAGNDVDATVRAQQAKRVEDAKKEAESKPVAGGSRTKFINSLDLDLKGEVSRLFRLDSYSSEIETTLLHSDAAKAHFDRIVQYLNNHPELEKMLQKFDGNMQKLIESKVADAAKTIANLVDVMSNQEQVGGVTSKTISLARASRAGEVNVDSLYEAVTTYLLGIEPPPANASFDDITNNYFRAFNNWEAIQQAAIVIEQKNPGYDFRSAEYWATKGLIDKYHGDPSKPDSYWDEAKRKDLAREIVDKGCAAVAG